MGKKAHQLYREGQEDQLGALGFVINTIVVWNTRYIESTLQVLRNRGHMIDNDDISRLSPLGPKHINYSRKVFIYSPRRIKR
ncbi:Tn3 family transposase [Bacillus thuringiensis]|nr:transposase [Bacillus thuringiensis]MCU5281611.1 transposase [Bacillus cereus]MCT6946619.1 transposase [Bacillus thuringiensis]MEC3296942.1 Tn3 family transposase [Bacillus thuringiensis]MEC3399592.1 Tn3 family transposase [Bacillus thuringiensis]MED2067179.1 Tn3 family transposase [Bacillus thuringiensis]